jgi:hypothetical protein
MLCKNHNIKGLQYIIFKRFFSKKLKAVPAEGITHRRRSDLSIHANSQSCLDICTVADSDWFYMKRHLVENILLVDFLFSFSILSIPISSKFVFNLHMLNRVHKYFFQYRWTIFFRVIASFALLFRGFAPSLGDSLFRCLVHVPISASGVFAPKSCRYIRQIHKNNKTVLNIWLLDVVHLRKLQMHYLIVILFVPVLKLYSVFFLFCIDKPRRCLRIRWRWFIYPCYGINLPKYIRALSSSNLLKQSPEYIVLIRLLLHFFYRHGRYNYSSNPLDLGIKHSS